MMLKGTAASPGIGIGGAWWVTSDMDCRQRPVNVPDSGAGTAAEGGLAAFRSAVQQAASEINNLTAMMNDRLGAAEAGIFRAQLFLLDDPLWLRETEALIRIGRSPQEAVAAAAEKFAGLFMASGDAALQERVADIRDVAARITAILSGRGNGKESPAGAGDVVLLAEEIYPSLVAVLDPARVRGLVTGSGGYTAHAAIIARALGVPAVMGVAGLNEIKTGTAVIVDGDKGEVIVSPDGETLQDYRQRTTPRTQGGDIRYRTFSPACTRDGVSLLITANAGTISEAKLARSAGAAGIGLYRTEYAYLENDRWPAEEELYEEYAAVLNIWPDGEVVFRSFDLGGDKLPAYINLPREENPMLGIRGIRLARMFPEHFTAQLKALLRAAAYGRIKIMVPLVTCLDEFRWAGRLLREARKATGCSGLPPFGLMVEVPAVALMLDRFAEMADFFSLGTNDLVQYTLAVDRIQSGIYKGQGEAGQPYFHPGFLRLVRTAVTTAGKARKPVSICGEMAGDMRAVPLLLGLGIRSFSTGVDRLPELKEYVSSLNIAGCREIAHKAKQLATMEEVCELVKNLFTGQGGSGPGSVRTPPPS